MVTTTIAFIRRYSLVITATAAFILPGCGASPLSSGNKEASGSTLNSTITDPNWGTFELVATGANPANGKEEFLVRSSRSITKNQLRFVWDFGDGPAGEGLTQSHTFSENGTYTITVTAYGGDDRVAFVLKLTLDIGVSNNQAPIVTITADDQAMENDLVFLYGGGSSDPDGDEITYEWV